MTGAMPPGGTEAPIGPVEPVVRPTVTLGDRFGPEMIAGLIVLILVLGGVVTYLVAGTGATPDASEAPPATVAPASPAGSATTGSGQPSVDPSRSPTVASAAASALPSLLRPAWASTASLLLGADARLIERREALRAVLATNPKTAADLARELRATSAEIQIALASVRDLDLSGAPAGLVDRLMTPHQAAADATLDVLGRPIGDVAAYKTASTTVVASLGTLEPLMRDLAKAAGLPNPIPSIPASPGSSAAPSAAP